MKFVNGGNKTFAKKNFKGDTHKDIVTYRLNRPWVRFSENV